MVAPKESPNQLLKRFCDYLAAEYEKEHGMQPHSMKERYRTMKKTFYKLGPRGRQASIDQLTAYLEKNA